MRSVPFAGLSLWKKLNEKLSAWVFIWFRNSAQVSWCSNNSLTIHWRLTLLLILPSYTNAFKIELFFFWHLTKVSSPALFRTDSRLENCEIQRGFSCDWIMSTVWTCQGLEYNGCSFMSKSPALQVYRDWNFDLVMVLDEKFGDRSDSSSEDHECFCHISWHSIQQTQFVTVNTNVNLMVALFKGDSSSSDHEYLHKVSQQSREWWDIQCWTLWLTDITIHRAMPLTRLKSNSCFPAHRP